MTGGTRREAIELAQRRWAAIHSFDLEAEQWQALFSQYPAGVILEAIRGTQCTRDPRPERRYAHFMEILARLTAKLTDHQA
jgi:hypothetical protein